MPACAVCGEEIAVPADVELDELVECAACGAEYEVTGLDPISLFEEDEK